MSEAVQGIAQIALTVTDREAARAFYRDVLGLRFLFDAGTMMFFDCGGVRLLVGTGNAASIHADGGTMVYFRVTDLEGVAARMRAQGVAMVQEPHLVAPMQTHDLWLAFVKDPAGNVLGLMEEKAR
ncbi:MAG TPA: VOC family protein [Acidobacteriaceae bacterium]|jgi:methylmalonyl-CoA/ethylmalonyl-CoA epimerase|nr:VOC family protein [Acidobacteriaceae bacterium]